MVLPNTGNCFRCGEPGHWAASCPLAIPATTRTEHETRIARIVERWIAGEMLTHEKRRLIEEENAMWNGKKTGARN